MVSLALEYWLLVFVAALGVIQAGAIRGGLQGLCFFKSPNIGRICAILLVLIAFARFFLPMDRNVRGLEGFQQTYLFTAGALSALAFTLVLSSWLRRGLSPGQGEGKGLQVLKDRTYFQALWGRQKGGG